MTDADVLALAYQRQSAGDTRSFSEIVAAIRLDAEALRPPPNPAAVVAAGRLVLPDGTVQGWSIYGDGNSATWGE